MNSYKKGRKSIALNNLGVSYIESEDYFDAIIVLSKALNKCQNVVQTIEQRQQKGNKNIQSNNNDEKERTFHLDSWVSDRNILTDQYDNNKHIDLDTSFSKISFGSISRRTIVIPEVVPESKIHMVPTAILFNLSLAYYLYGIEKENNMEALVTAQELYNMVLDYHLTTDTPPATCIIFLMSCVNNLGLLYKELDDIEMSEFFFEKLISMLMCIVDHYPSDERPCDLDDFFQNTMHLILPSYSVMAAAA